MSFKANRRHNPFPGRQGVLFRRKLLSRMFKDLKCLEKESRLRQNGSIGIKRARTESTIAAEAEEFRNEHQIPQETIVVETEDSNGARTPVNCEEEPESSLSHMQETLPKETEDENLSDHPRRIPNCADLYFDDATGLIEVVGVPKPELPILDHMSKVRSQVETMLEEWERYNSSRTMCFDPL